MIVTFAMLVSLAEDLAELLEGDALARTDRGERLIDRALVLRGQLDRRGPTRGHAGHSPTGGWSPVSTTRQTAPGPSAMVTQAVPAGHSWPVSQATSQLENSGPEGPAMP